MPNANPTISADHLGTYLVSPPTRRQALLERAKYPGIYTDPFAKARELAVDVMLGYVQPDLPALARNVHGGQMLADFLGSWDHDPTMRPVDRRPVLEVAGVQVTGATPDVLTKRRVGHRTRLGGLAFAFEPISKQHAQIRLALMHHALERLCGPEVVTQAFTTEDASVVVSLPTGEVFKGGPFTAVWRDIERACDEIRRMWPTV
jgi:hypothetical protein